MCELLQYNLDFVIQSKRVATEDSCNQMQLPPEFATVLHQSKPNFWTP